MFFAFFESIKYVGHLFPMAILRIYVGIWFFQQALLKFEGEYLTQPKLASAITEYLPGASAANWYKHFLDGVVVPHWQIFAYTLVYFEFLIGAGLILGLLSRPIALFAAIISWNYMFISPPEQLPFLKLLLVVNLIMAWLGAGRCLGMDYFFYKRQRGLLW